MTEQYRVAIAEKENYWFSDIEKTLLRSFGFEVRKNGGSYYFLYQTLVKQAALAQAERAARLFLSQGLHSSFVEQLVTLAVVQELKFELPDLEAERQRK